MSCRCRDKCGSSPTIATAENQSATRRLLRLGQRLNTVFSLSVARHFPSRTLHCRILMKLPVEKEKEARNANFQVVFRDTASHAHKRALLIPTPSLPSRIPSLYTTVTKFFHLTSSERGSQCELQSGVRDTASRAHNGRALLILPVALLSYSNSKSPDLLDCN